MKVVAVIPARYTSQRLPGKPLLPILGIPLIKRVYDNACTIKSLTSIAVATDDVRIQEYCSNAKIPVIMTSGDHQSGSSRVFEAAKQLEYDYLLNIQGDEPFLHGPDIDNLIQFTQQNDWPISTVAAPILSQEIKKDPNVVKVVLNKTSMAMYFSRSEIPFRRKSTSLPTLQHVGIYLFRKSTIENLQSQETAAISEAESLEQLTWLFHGLEIGVHVIAKPTIGIDTAEDIVLAENILLARENES